MSFLWTDLVELRTILQLDPNNHSEDFTLGLYNEWASSILEEVLDNPIGYAIRTVVYPGTGTQKLLLRNRPVYPILPPLKASGLAFTPISVVLDEGGNWGFSSGGFISGDQLVLGTDYGIRIDRDDGGSREAILYRLQGLWPRPICRQAGLLSPFVGQDMGSVQVSYTAGFTIDTLPATLRAAAEMLIIRLNRLFPLGMQVSSESYIERSIGLTENQRRYLMGLVRPFALFWRNWKW